MAKPSLQKDALRKVLRYLKRYWVLILLSLVFAAATVALTLYVPVLVGDAIDLILGPGHVDFPGIFRLLATTAVLAGVTALLQWLMNTINNKITYQVVRDIRVQAFEHLEQLSARKQSEAFALLTSKIRRELNEYHGAKSEEFQKTLHKLSSDKK